MARPVGPAACPDIPTTLGTGDTVELFNADSVAIDLKGNSLGHAEEIPRMAPIEGPITTGAELLQHLTETGSMPWMDPALVAKLQGL